MTHAGWLDFGILAMGLWNLEVGRWYSVSASNWIQSIIKSVDNKIWYSKIRSIGNSMMERTY